MMISYRESLRRLRNPSFENIRAIARNFIPAADKDNAIPASSSFSAFDQDMLTDLCENGVLWKTKIDKTLETIPRKIFQDDVFEIIDWQCGQGIHTVCFFDFLKKNGIENRVRKITLIDSSREALERAVWHISPYMDDPDRISCVCKSVSEVRKKEIETRQPITFHFFTDVLEQPELDLKRIAELVGYGIHGKHYFFCTGNLMHNNRRIDAFYHYFDSPETLADEELYPNVRQSNGIKIKAFKLENSNFNLKYVNYYPAVQYHAAYRLDAVKRALQTADAEKTEALYRSLTCFEVSAHYDLGGGARENVHPLFAVLNNLVTRGRPTQASPLLEEAFAPLGNRRIDLDGDLRYDTRGLHAEDVFDALHIIDPRLNLDESNYNNKLLESDAEKTFITRIVPQPLRQLLQPQRNLYSLTKQKASHTQRIDFACEFPYPTKDEKDFWHDGCAIEIHETLFHSGMEQKRADKQRADDLSAIHWDCRQVPEEELGDSHFGFLGSEYVATVFKVFDRRFDDDWVRTLQYVLSPIAVARIQKVVLEAMISRRLEIARDMWSVLVIERDVPCAALALADLKEHFNHLTAMSAEYAGLTFPEVELTIVSTPEFIGSPLHGNTVPLAEVTDELRRKTYDLIIDISMLRRTDIENISFVGFTECRNQCFFHIRSSHYGRSTRHMYTTGRITYRPLTFKNARQQYETLPDTSQHLRYFLQLLFRKNDFIPGMLPVLSRILQNRCTVGLVPANGGKTVIRKLTAMMQPGITVIAVPDTEAVQVLHREWIDAGIDCVTALHAGLDRTERERRERRTESSETLIIALSYDQLGRFPLLQRFRYMQQTGVYFATGILDEVQGLSEWSPDFLPASMLAGQTLYRHTLPQQGKIALLGLTERASFDMLFDIEQALSPGDACPTDRDRLVLCKSAGVPESAYRKERYLRYFCGLEAENECIEHLIGYAPVSCLEGDHTIPAKGCYFPLTLDNLPDERILFLPYPATERDGPKDDRSKKDPLMLYTKAFYRMSTLGLMKQITFDEAQQQYRIVLQKQPAGGYYRQLRNYFLRYHTRKQAEQEMVRAENLSPKTTFHDALREELCRCLLYMNEFVYRRIALQQQETTEIIAGNGNPLTYHLTEDTQNGRVSSPDILFRYMHRIKDDATEQNGSPNSRVRELHEAVCTLRRSFDGNNPTLSLLNAFCLFHSGTDGEEMLECDLHESYENGMIGFYRSMANIADFRELFDAYNCYVRGETDYFATTGDWTEEVRIRIDIMRAADLLNLHLAQTKMIQHKYLEEWKQ
ncbi:hypothetical protein [Tannerella forsythia]